MAKAPTKAVHPQPEHTKKEHKAVRPIGGYVLAKDPIEINVGRPRTKLTVRNTGDRPIQIGSHFHFFETNRYLDFDRAAAFGQRLDIPANTAVRFEPGDEKEVTLVPYAGKQFVYGFNNLVDGWTGDGPTPDYRPNREAAIERAQKRGFKFRTDGKTSSPPPTSSKPSAGKPPAGKASASKGPASKTSNSKTSAKSSAKSK